MKNFNSQILKSTLAFAFLMMLMTVGIAAQDGKSALAGSWKDADFSMEDEDGQGFAIIINDKGTIDSFSVRTMANRRYNLEELKCENSTAVTEFKNENGQLSFSFGCGYDFKAKGFLDGETLKIELSFQVTMVGSEKGIRILIHFKFDLKREADENANAEKPAENTAANSWTGSANININENGKESESTLEISDLTVNGDSVSYAFTIKIGGNPIQCSNGGNPAKAARDGDALSFSLKCGNLEFTAEAKPAGENLKLEIEGKEAAKNLAIEKATLDLLRKK